MEPKTLIVTIEKARRYDKIALEGRLDSDTAFDFEQQIVAHLKSKPPHVLIDMAKLHYISSAGLRVIAVTMKICRTYKGNVQLARMQPQIKKVFDIVGIVPLTQIFSTVEELDGYLDAMQREGEA
jgi:anti-anti-sigma factor